MPDDAARMRRDSLPGKLLLVLAIAVIAVSGCRAAMVGQWQKPGADGQTTTRDASTCRDTARAEASQRLPDRVGAPAPFGVPSAHQRDDLSRSSFEASRFEDCMQRLGYRRG